ncbi:helix-turn-helix domain-containing protein [Streptomyces yaizuensis]|uniref:Scr1 family TA system antitoxin-like transcriptional regulator n=1 Tax=Streptomyces yaizuensis TaxID=2989713 RepID=A0ABQ5P408_9ACTN|nr:helix-turn-helix transcriptional regulator [Streptomyces sp. YSPA8]GLF97336.1 Scr1 family TA system antitoxin-like transcriptional regulator [Streptomyces sp. YSPA8]
MPPRTTTTARQRRVGAELRKMREATGINAREAAALLGVDHTKVSHVETARFGISARRLRALADIYGCTDRTYVDALVEMATDRTKGWDEEYRGVLPAGFLDLTDLERRATSLRTYQIAHLPGLTQTEEYARAVFRFGFPRLSPEDAEVRIAHRLRRARVLDRVDGPDFSAVIHEAALRMRFGGMDTVRGQLGHLLELSERPNCTLRVLTFEADGFAGSGQSVLLAGGPVPWLDTVHLDSAHGAQFLHTEAELDVYRELLGAAEERSLPPEQSREFIREIALGLRRI